MLLHRIVPGFNRIITSKQTLDACYPAVKLIHQEFLNISNEIKNSDIVEKKINLIIQLSLKTLNINIPITKFSVIKILI